MNRILQWKRKLPLLLAGLLLVADLAGQTVMVNTWPLLSSENEGAAYLNDVDSGIMDLLFEKGYIIFSQSSDDSEELLLASGRDTGADFVLSWKMEDRAVSGMLLDCRTGDIAHSGTISMDDLGNPVEDLHRMYAALGEELCEHLVPGNWN